jgi:diacylglycerol kinase (CTP)
LYHVMGLPITLACWNIGIPPLWAAIGLALIALTDLLVDICRLYIFPNTRFQTYFLRIMAPVLRESEVSSFNGMVWYFTGASLALFCFPMDAATLSICLLAVCDPAASFAGRFCSKFPGLGLRFLGGKKTVAGSLGAMAAGCVMTAAWLSLQPAAYGWLSVERYLYVVLVGGAAAAVGEMVNELVPGAWWVDDNLAVPMVAGAALSAVMHPMLSP